MDIVKLSTDWARAEVFSAKVVWLFSAIEVFAAIGFWNLSRTHMAKAFVWPLLLAGLFLVAIGAGLYLANKPRVEQFEKQYRQDADSFIRDEIQRTSKSKRELASVFRILPVIIIASAIVILLVPTSVWRAIAITAIVTAAFLMIVDSNTEARNDIYNSQLSSVIK